MSTNSSDMPGGVAMGVAAIIVGIWKGWPLLADSSIGQLFTSPAVLMMIPLIVIVVAYFVIAFIGLFGGMWITRGVKERNHYGIDKPSFPMKRPKI